MWFLAGDVLNSKVEFAVSPGQELMDPDGFESRPPNSGAGLGSDMCRKGASHVGD